MSAKGFNTEDDIRKHLNTHHKEILQEIDSNLNFKNSNQKDIVCIEQKSCVEKTKAKVFSKEPYTCKDCVRKCQVCIIRSQRNK